MPVTPNLYFAANNLPYQYQDGAAVYPSSPYVPPLTVLPTVSDAAAAYYQSKYRKIVQGCAPESFDALSIQQTFFFRHKPML